MSKATENTKTTNASLKEGALGNPNAKIKARAQITDKKLLVREEDLVVSDSVADDVAVNSMANGDVLAQSNTNSTTPQAAVAAPAAATEATVAAVAVPVVEAGVSGLVWAGLGLGGLGAAAHALFLCRGAAAGSSTRAEAKEAYQTAKSVNQ